MESSNILHDILDNLFHDIIDIEEKAIITDNFKEISSNDMHVIQAIGIDAPKNMSTVAKELSVTVGTLTIAINNLVKKGYVSRERSEKDRRVVLLSLTHKGRYAYRHYQDFHNEMISAVVEGLDADETVVLIRAFQNLYEFFKPYKK